MGLKVIPQLERAVHAVELYLASKDLHVTQAEGHVLAHLHGNRSVRVGDLHKAFGHRRSTLTSILDRLERRGLIDRAAYATDRRSVEVRLTRSGALLAARVFKVLSSYELRSLKRLGAEELAAFQKVVAAVTGA